MRQRPGETLRKYIQCFSQVRNKVPCVTDAAIISAFSWSVTYVKMLEKLAINDELDSAVKLFDLADRCAKAEEGRLFAHNDPDAEPASAPTKGKSKDFKRKTNAVLVAEPEQKHKRGEDAAIDGARTANRSGAPRGSPEASHPRRHEAARASNPHEWGKFCP